MSTARPVQTPASPRHPIPPAVCPVCMWSSPDAQRASRALSPALSPARLRPPGTCVPVVPDLRARTPREASPALCYTSRKPRNPFWLLEFKPGNTTCSDKFRSSRAPAALRSLLCPAAPLLERRCGSGTPVHLLFCYTVQKGKQLWKRPCAAN